MPAEEIVGPFAESERDGELEMLEYNGLVERVDDPRRRPVLYRASPMALELSKRPDRRLRQYAHILVELDFELDEIEGNFDPFAALAAAVDRVAGCTTLSTAIPPLQEPSHVAEGWVETIVEAHEFDDEDEAGEQLIDDATAVTALIRGPRRTL